MEKNNFVSWVILTTTVPIQKVLCKKKLYDSILASCEIINYSYSGSKARAIIYCQIDIDSAV